MSNAQVVYSNVDQDSGVVGALFEGRNFWIAQRCPMRSRFVDEVKRNGGTVVPLEKQADWLIVDHARKDIPVGGVSYRFIEESIKAGELLDPSAFTCGPPVGSVRAVGSIVRPAKTIRNPFTAEDDAVLTEWVLSSIRNGGTEMGNKIYQQLEAQNNGHTWQSWRDRWVKRLRTQQHDTALLPANNSPPTPPSDENEQKSPLKKPVRKPVAPKSSPRKRHSAVVTSPRSSLSLFSATEFHELFRVAKDIQDMTVRESKKAFASWAAEGSGASHTGEEWQALWDLRVQPVYEVIEAEKGRMKAYKTQWIKWNEENENETADEWLAYWQQKVQPMVEKVVSGEEEVARWDDEDVEQEEHDVAQPADPESPHKASEKSKMVPMREETPVQDNRDVEDRASNPASGSRSSQKQNLFINRSTQPLKRRFHEAEIQDSPEERILSPETKRMRMHLDSATKAGKTLNAVLDQTPSKGARSEPIEILDSASHTSSSEEEDLPVPRVTERLPQDTPDRRYSRLREEETEGIVDLEDEQEEELYDEGAALHNRQISPTLSFTAFPSNAADQTQFPEILPYEDGAEAIGSSPPFRPRILNTQTILAAETQPFEFSLPEPDLSDNEFVDARDILSDPDEAVFEDVPQAALLVPLSVHITNLIAGGHAEADILVSLRSTSMDRSLAAVVLRSLENGRGIPENIRGIWTEKDDMDAEGGDARMIRRVREKHGENGLGGFLGRLEFLRQYRLR